MYSADCSCADCKLIRELALRSKIDDANASDDPSLGMSADDAAKVRDEIIDADLADDAALAAHDLLHSRAIAGRAF
jgi:hypothetical protein